MASTTLTVTVQGGKPPVTIHTRLFKNNKLQIELSSTKSFTHPFSNLGKGDYLLFISGMNPSGGNTTCELTLDEIALNPPDPSPTTNSDLTYWVIFRFTVN